MSIPTLITPFFQDRYSPELATLSAPAGQPAWQVNCPTLPDGTLMQRIAAYNQPIAEFVAAAVARGDRPVSIAGDCLTAIAFMAGLQRAGQHPVLIWLDAHGDFNTWETSPSGFLGGMPLAMLVGRGELTLAQVVGLRSVPEEDVILCDARDLDPGEKLALNASRVVHLRELPALLTHALLARPLYIHFDTDLVNPADAPAMSYATPGGPSFTETRAVFRALAKTRQIVGVSVSTWNPQLDTDGRTQAACMSLLFDLTGQHGAEA
jgi:arginase